MNGLSMQDNYDLWQAPSARQQALRGITQELTPVAWGQAAASGAMMDAMTSIPPPLVTREALRAFTQRLVEHLAPQKVILFGSQARGRARWDSDADILVVMPFEGSSFEQRLTMLQVGASSFPVDLLLCRPEAAAQRYDWGDPFIREALDHGEVLHG
jgi:predicted nucleotidyltransferase